ncbi:hypothetical protein ACFCY8_28460 [Streptomyces noursei]|uniref:hypothetical protein n=1 Tax=Streptomyces noursei TaxID=1971 RepID=UPI0035DF7F7F
MTLPTLLLILLFGIVMLLIGVGVLAMLLSRPAWCAPFAGALAAMMLVVTITGLLVDATHR